MILLFIRVQPGKPLLGRGDQLKANNDQSAGVNGSTPCSSEPCGENAVCWNSGYAKNFIY